MPIGRRSFLVLAVLAVLTAGGLLAYQFFSRADAQTAKMRTEPLTVTSGGRVHDFTVEVAETAEDRARGLMFREFMAEDHGMLFVFEASREQHFWMKNTPLPLDILFIARGGTIVRIAENTTPFSEKHIPSYSPAKFVLELNAGLTEKLGIKAGDRVSSASMAGG